MCEGRFKIEGYLLRAPRLLRTPHGADNIDLVTRGRKVLSGVSQEGGETVFRRVNRLRVNRLRVKDL